MIAIDATALQSEHRHRGVGLYLRQLIAAFEDRPDVRPHYLVSRFGIEHVRHLPPERMLVLPRPHWPAHTYWAYNEIVLGAALKRLQPRVFLAPDFNGLVMNPFGSTVAVLHDLIVLKPGASPPARVRGPSRLASDLRWWVYLRKLARADAIITVTASIRSDAEQLLGISAERLHVVRHGVDMRRFHPAVGEGPYALMGRYFVNVGGRDFTKNQGRIVAAFAKAIASASDADVMLYFAGPWTDNDRRWLRDVSHGHGVSNRVRYLGYVPDGELPSLYGNALGLVFTSLEEGFGLPVLEAMSCGAPVITSDRATLREVAGTAAILADPLSIDAIAEALCQLLLDEALRADLRRRGFERARSFSWAHTAERTLRVLLQTEQAGSTANDRPSYT